MGHRTYVPILGVNNTMQWTVLLAVILLAGCTQTVKILPPPRVIRL